MNILHLSDLHLTSNDQKGDPVNAFNQDVVTTSMLSFIRDSEIKPDAVIITGDLVKKGKAEEYKVAEVFCNKLLDVTGLEREQMFIVPGNHDVDRGYITPRQIKRLYPFGTQDEITEILKDPDDFSILMRKFSAFNTFAKQAMNRELFTESQFWFVVKHHLKGYPVNLVGLNTCLFAGYDEDEKQKLALSMYQVEKAIQNLDENALSIGFFHHPFACHHPCDKPARNRLTHKLDLILTGHLHESDNAFVRNAAGQAVIIGAGAGFETRESRNSFNLIEIDLETGEGRVQFYKYLSDHNCWKKDTDVNPGQDNGCFSWSFKNKKIKPVRKKQVKITTDAAVFDFEKEIQSYQKNAASLHENLPLMGFKTSLRVPILIEDIYVPLRAMIDRRPMGKACFADAEDAEKCLRESGLDNEISVPKAFQVTEQMKRRGIVILGDPGSGKTTHLKRLLLWCLRDGTKDLGLPEDMLPVFLPLRELKDLESGLDTFIQEQLRHPHLDTAEGFGKRLLERGNLLLLFDGLDEVAEPKDRIRAARWIDDALKIYKTSRFVVTCRFAGYTNEARLSEGFLEMHMRPLSEDQAAEFVRNWYRIVESGFSTNKEQAKKIADDRANDLVDRLRQPEFRARRVFEMTRNPLLLTNLCLVHYTRGNLPHTRGNLYEECTDVLLELWRKAVGLKLKVTSQTGRRVLQPAALWMHQEEGRTRATADELSPIIEPVIKAVGWPHGSGKEFLKVVRDESGILTGWDQEHYGFMHLGFQEYLAAREIRNQAFTNPDILKELASQFGESWWQEVYLLMLALEEPSLFVPFMREVVKRPEFARRSDLVEMCLDDSLEKTPLPFIELLEKNPGKDKGLWERQLVALRIVERIDESVLEKVITGLKNHPFEKIQKWIQDRYAEKKQDVIYADLGGYELVFIPGGTFMMGSPETEEGRYDDEGPQHQVTVSDFYIGRYPVTNEEYNRFLEANPGAKEPDYWSDRQFNQSKQPVVGVSWNDAQEYAKWAGLRLPTEAEWEYACRAGTQTRYYTGDSEEDLERAGWYDKNSDGQTHSVGQKEPNGFGLYDMHGNVWEWVEDQWHKNHEGAPSDGSAWRPFQTGGNQAHLELK